MRQTTEGVTERANDWNLNIPWYRLLAVSIIQRAWLDMRTLEYEQKDLADISGSWVYRVEVEKFFDSRWCSTLLTGVYGTEIDGKYVKESAKNVRMDSGKNAVAC